MKETKTTHNGRHRILAGGLLLLQAFFFTTAAQAQITTEQDDMEIVVIDEQGNEDEFDFPETMMQNIDSLLNLYHSKTYLTSEDDCQMNGSTPTYEKEVYIDRLRRMPTVMEMPYNDVVQGFIDRYTGRLRRSVSFMLGASNFYMPLFEEALDANQLPLELKYLPIIESALNPKAVSRAGATGLWQFMLTTAKDYGLEVNSLVDERCDPVRASYAAAHYLSDLYKIFGDWNLVIAAYNCGPANVSKAIHRASTEKTPDGKPVSTKDYWEIYPYLPKETRGYVPAFIAANYVMNYYCEHNICPMRCELPTKTDTVMVDRNVHLSQIAGVLGIDIDMLRALNPSYRRDIVPGSTHPSPIRMHPSDATRFIDLQDSIYNYNINELLPKRDVTKVKVVSGKKRTKGRVSRSSGRKAGTVTVRKGDTLSAIAKRNGVSVSRLRKMNGIKGNNIRAGQKLKVK